MGSFLDKPKTEKSNESGAGNELRYGLAAMQGWRIEMEDSHSSLVGLPRKGLEKWSFFAVFDGHAGATVSKCLSIELINSILAADEQLFDELAALYADTDAAASLNECNGESCNNSESNDKEASGENTTTTSNSVSGESTCSDSASTSTTTTKTVEKQQPSTTAQTVASYTEKLDERLKRAIRQGFLDLDEKIRRMPEFDRGEDKSGSTAVACLISPSHLYLINCGDSRAIFVSDNKVVLGTHDHKPINQAERERIQNAGGSVMIQRVNGSLAVSRALGDFEYKCVEGRGPCEQLVSPEPEIYSRERLPIDEFVVLACDGIWDVMTNEELKDYVHARLKVTDDLVRISNDVLDTCLNKGSRDNMSLIIVSFPGAPRVQAEEVERDQLCNEKIETRVKELLEASEARMDFTHVLQSIAQEKWDEMPPGAGIYAKQSLIEEVYYRLNPRPMTNSSNDSDCEHDSSENPIYEQLMRRFGIKESDAAKKAAK